MCKLLQVSKSSYYYWRGNPLSKRKQEDLMYLGKIEAIYLRSKGTYGSPRITKDLQMQGYAISSKRVANLMQQANLRSVVSKHFKYRYRKSKDCTIMPNLLGQKFTVERINEVWVSDITFIPTAQGWLFLTVILDLFDRKIIGWAMSDSLQAKDSTIPAWHMAVKNRPIASPLIFHSDRGVQYTCREFKEIIKKYPMLIQSMNRKGNCYDNAVAESFFKSLKSECTYRYKFKDKRQAKNTIFQYIEAWYNRTRRHQDLGRLNICEFNQLNHHNYNKIGFNSPS